MTELALEAVSQKRKPVSKRVRPKPILAAERKAVYALLGLVGEHPQIYHRHMSPYDVCEIFARLLTLEDSDVLRIQAFCLCETLAVDSSEVEAIGILTAPDFGAYWSPDDAFFDILRDKPTINAMVKDIAGKSCADGAVTDTAKLQKQIIKNRIAGHGVNEACQIGSQDGRLSLPNPIRR